MNNTVIKFAGDSGDGIQLMGTIFSSILSTLGYQVRTTPSFPADMRPPKNSIAGVSSFKIHFGEQVNTEGEKCDIIICLCDAAYEVCKNDIKENGLVIIDESKTIIPKFHWTLPITAQCKELNTNKSKNIFALSCLCYYFDIPEQLIKDEISKKFIKKEEIKNLNLKTIEAAYSFCNNMVIEKRPIVFGKIKNTNAHELLSGCTAAFLGVKRAAQKINRQLFLASYPITPATQILIDGKNDKKNGTIAVQAEDEIAACCMAIGASFAGSVAVTSTSGPGMCLKSEAINLAVISELPLVIIDVQRGGPSTGLPTKTEQSDLNIAINGRSGDSPIPVIAAKSPADCFIKGYEAVKLAVENATPVVLLLDAYIGQGLEMTDISCNLPDILINNKWRYIGNNNPIVLGGSECDPITNTITTDPINHAKMTLYRKTKIDSIKIPDLAVEGEGKILLVGWGSTYGKIQTVREELSKIGKNVAQVHFSYMYPFEAKNVSEVFNKFQYIIVIEQNDSQFYNMIKHYCPNNILSYTQINGEPLNVNAIVDYINTIY